MYSEFAKGCWVKGDRVKIKPNSRYKHEGHKGTCATVGEPKKSCGTNLHDCIGEGEHICFLSGLAEKMNMSEDDIKNHDPPLIKDEDPKGVKTPYLIGEKPYLTFDNGYQNTYQFNDLVECKPN